MLIAKQVINLKSKKLNLRALLFTLSHSFFITEKIPEEEFSFFGYFPFFWQTTTDA